MEPIICIAGIPGSGKTTLTNNLLALLGGIAISTGDIARRVDPSGISAGGLADEDSFRAAFRVALQDAYVACPGGPVFLDGLPRTEAQLAYLDGNPWQMILLTCRPDIARDRLLRRGREDDDPAIIERRIREQSDLLAVDKRDGWAFLAASWHANVNTGMKGPDQIAADVAAYLRGEKSEAY